VTNKYIVPRELARGDVEAAVDHYVLEAGIEVALGFVDALEAAYDLIARHPDVDEAGIRTAMSGNLCRCTGYQGIVRSIKSAARQLSSAQGKQP